MLKRIVAIAVAVIFAVIFSACASYADSMLTSPPTDSDDGLLMIGDDANDAILKKEAGQNDILFVNLKKKSNTIWGPQAKKAQVVVDEEISETYDESKFKPIHVRCRVSVPNPAYRKASTSYKYSKQLSSRHKSASASRKTIVAVSTIDITPIIIREAKKNGLSPMLLKAVIQTESNFNPYAVSCAGARGLCQLMPGTARMLGVTDPFNPEQSISGGAKYLGLLKKRYQTVELMLAAYNAGPGTVRRAGGVPNIAQTRHYIVKVKRNMRKW